MWNIGSFFLSLSPEKTFKILSLTYNINAEKQFGPWSDRSIWSSRQFNLGPHCMQYLLQNKIVNNGGDIKFSPQWLLTLKAPPIICSRRQFQILPLFQNSKSGMIFHENRLLKDVPKFVACCSCEWRFKG